MILYTWPYQLKNIPKTIMNLQFFHQNKDKFKNFELFLGNLPPKIEPSVLQRIFSRWGNVEKVTIKSRDIQSWTALIKFSSFFDMVKAFQKSYKVKIDGYKLKVKPSKNCFNECRFDSKLIKQKESLLTGNNDKKNMLLQKMYQIQHAVQKKLSQRFVINQMGQLNGCIQSAKNIRKIIQERELNKKIEKDQEFNLSFIKKKNKLQGSKALIDHSQFLSYVADFRLFDEEQKLDTTTYEDKSQFTKSQKEPSFVQINSPKSDILVLISLKEEWQLQKLWQSNFFSGFIDENGEMVRIVKHKKDNFIS